MSILFEKATVLAEVDKLIEIIECTSPDSILDTIRDIEEMVEMLDEEEVDLINLLNAIVIYSKGSIKSKYIGLEALLPNPLPKINLLKDYTGKLEDRVTTLPPKPERTVYVHNSGSVYLGNHMHLDYQNKKRGKSGRLYPMLGCFRTIGYDKDIPQLTVKEDGTIVSVDGTIPEWWDNDKDGVCYVPLSIIGQNRYTGAVFVYDGMECAMVKAATPAYSTK